MDSNTAAARGLSLRLLCLFLGWAWAALGLLLCRPLLFALHLLEGCKLSVQVITFLSVHVLILLLLPFLFLCVLILFSNDLALDLWRDWWGPSSLTARASPGTFASRACSGTFASRACAGSLAARAASSIC